MNKGLTFRMAQALAGREPIDYSIPSLFAGVLIFDPSNRFNVHAKVGYAQLHTDAASHVIEKQQNSEQIALGAGARVRLGKRLELQVEHEYYDKDARQTGARRAVRVLRSSRPVCSKRDRPSPWGANTPGVGLECYLGEAATDL